MSKKLEKSLGNITLITVLVLAGIILAYVFDYITNGEVRNLLTSINRKSLTGHYSITFFTACLIVVAVLFLFTIIFKDKKDQKIAVSLIKHVILLAISVLILIVLPASALGFAINNKIGFYIVFAYVVYLATMILSFTIVLLFRFIAKLLK